MDPAEIVWGAEELKIKLARGLGTRACLKLLVSLQLTPRQLTPPRTPL